MGEQIDRKDLAEHVKRLRAGGKTVVFTNGASTFSTWGTCVT